MDAACGFSGHDRPMRSGVLTYWKSGDRFRRAAPHDLICVLGHDRRHLGAAAVRIGVAVGAADGFGGTGTAARHDSVVPAGLLTRARDRAWGLSRRDQVAAGRAGFRP